MDYKVLIKLIVPEVEKSYEIFIPINRTVGEVCMLINQLVNEDTSKAFPIKKEVALCNRLTSEFYPMKKYIRDTNIRNGSQLVFI